MKCKKCGNEVDIGEVFCQKCGTAIQIVPEYNPLDFEIEVPLEEKNRASLEQERKKQRKREQMRRRKRRQIMLLAGITVVLAAAVAAGAVAYIKYNEVHSYDYQYQLGMEYYENGEYGAAIRCFSEALKYNTADIQARLVEAESYNALGEYDRMVEVLLEAVNISGSSAHYKKLMEACELAGNTELMNRILRETQGTAVGDTLAEYRTGELSVNPAGGEYHDHLSITLSNSQPDSVIYYTLDGTEPSAGSSVYEGPIAMEKVGSTMLRAVAVNEAGLAGEEIEAVYTISLLVPDPPVIKPDSGTYEYSSQIEVEVPEGGIVYYTVDGTTPDKERSAAYTEPVAMPIGNTIFSAILVDKYGVASAPVKKNYECRIDRPFPYDAAVIKLKNYLVSLGIMSDLNGNRGNGERINVQFVRLAGIAGADGAERECYVFTLRRTAAGETATLAEMLYSVDTENGDVHTLAVKSDGGYAYQPDSR